MAVFFNSLGALALGPLVPTIASELHTTVALVGQASALMMLMAGALGLIVGPLAEHFGFRGVLVWALLAGVVSALGTALAPTYQLLLLVSLMGAFGRAAIQPVAQAVVGGHFEGEDALRRRAMSHVSAGAPGAGIAGLPLLTTLSVVLGWRGAFAALRQRPSIRDLLAQYQPLLRHTSTLSTIAATVLGNASTWAVWTYVVAFLVQRYEVSTLQVGLIYLVVGVAVLLGTLLAGGRAGRHPRRLLITGRAGGGLLLGAALLLSVPVLIAVAAIAAALLLHAASGLASVNLLSEEAPTGRATSLALNGSALSLGVALGGALGGVGLEFGGYSTLRGRWWRLIMLRPSTKT